MSSLHARVLLLAGPSGSGKSHLARASGLPVLRLDDFYRDADAPDLPVSEELGTVDWDDIRSWDADAAARALDQLCCTGRVEVPVYDIATSRAVGTRQVSLDGHHVVVAEGLFAPQMQQRCRERGLAVDSLLLHRAPLTNAVRRLVRDVREHRKPLPVLLRRGWALLRAEPGLQRAAQAHGARLIRARPLRALLATAAAESAPDAEHRR